MRKLETRKRLQSWKLKESEKESSLQNGRQS